tara:strand:+ start:775 stop:927 length:153 start_codon:yes stop_codon:yes gene_type:complete
MEDPNFTKMSPDYKKRYRDMIQKTKKKKKKDTGESAIDRITRILYGGSNK